jgi:thiamine pyrophosphate-dependent acetolactate synthase large subunit-like protein
MKMPSRNVTVKKSELLSKLAENKKKHVEEYNLAVEEYKKVAKQDIADKKKKLAKQLDELSKKLDTEPVVLSIDEDLSWDTRPPKSYESTYADAIELFNAEVAEEVVLTTEEFNQYYLNKFAFANELRNSRTFYAVKQMGFNADE